MKKVFVIAEVGVNHDGDLQKAIDLVSVASESGADAVKFQSFNSSELATYNAPKAEYQKRFEKKDNNQLEMLRKLELSYEDQIKIFQECTKKNIEFMSTAFDQESLSFLIDHLGVKKLKIASGEITNAPFLISHGKSNLEIILSTGMSNIEEIDQALKFLCFGNIKTDDIPKDKKINEVYASDQSQNYLKEKVSLLHCTTQYPAKDENLNLNAINTLKENFNLRVGYSDHSKGILASSNAVSLGAEIIEKHFTLDKNASGPDHSSSLEPDELKDMISNIRRTENFLGDGIKKAIQDEFENLIVARKSIYAKKSIKIGDKFSDENISIKRPGSGLSPIRYWDLLGKVSRNNYLIDEEIKNE